MITINAFVTCVITAFILGVIFGITVVPTVIYKITTKGNSKAKDYVDKASKEVFKRKD